MDKERKLRIAVQSMEQELYGETYENLLEKYNTSCSDMQDLLHKCKSITEEYTAYKADVLENMLKLKALDEKTKEHTAVIEDARENLKEWYENQIEGRNRYIEHLQDVITGLTGR